MGTRRGAGCATPGWILGLVTVTVSAQGMAAPPYGESGLSWEQIQLFYPSQALLLAESRGRVTIYDGLYQSDVDRAMDEQFGRIDKMMFIRTRQGAEAGSDTEEDCD